MGLRSYLSSLLGSILTPVNVESLSLDDLQLLLDLLSEDVLNIIKNGQDKIMIIIPKAEEFPMSLAVKYVSGSYLIYSLPKEECRIASLFAPVPSRYVTPRLLVSLLREYPSLMMRYIVDNCRRALHWWLLTEARRVYDLFRRLYNATPAYYSPAVLNLGKILYPVDKGVEVLVLTYPTLRVNNRLDIDKSRWLKKVVSTLYRYYGDRLDSVVLTGSATSPAYVLVREGDRLKLGDTTVRNGVIMVKFLNVPLLLPSPRE